MGGASPEERAVEAAKQTAREVRRFFKSGREKAEVDSYLVPLIYRLATTTDILGKNEFKFGRNWAKNKNTFQSVLT
jgi:hypothetical protein